VRRAIIDATFAVEQKLVDAGLQVGDSVCIPDAEPSHVPVSSQIKQDLQLVLEIEQLLRQPLIYALQCNSGALSSSPPLTCTCFNFSCSVFLLEDLDACLTAHQRLDTAAAASTLLALRSHLDHELTEVMLLTSQ
jgi:hypothetical protein